MKDIERDALQLVLDGRVELKHATFDDDGRVIDGYAIVQGDGGMYAVTINGDATTCTCKYGETRRDAGGHKHDIALRLQALDEGGTDA